MEIYVKIKYKISPHRPTKGKTCSMCEFSYNYGKKKQSKSNKFLWRQLFFIRKYSFNKKEENKNKSQRLTKIMKTMAFYLKYVRCRLV